MNQPSGSCYCISLAEEMDLVHGEDVEVCDGAHLQGDDEDIDMDFIPDYDNPSPHFEDPHESQDDPDPGIFVENYEGCAEAFPGGETFMDQFRHDQYAEHR